MVREVVNKVMEGFYFEVEASGRHIHLDRPTIDALFGKGYQLTKAKDLSQPGQFACKERVTIVGPKGELKNVVILGPERKKSQVEVSLTDARALGVQVPVRESGDIKGTPGITLVSGDQRVELTEGCIAAKRHVHMSPSDAKRFQVEDKEIVQVKVMGDRPLIFDDVVIRVHPNYRTYMHIDIDEANACGHKKGTLGQIIKRSI
ncbi:ethanolamine utilization phosphate acetyltransferase EutD [Pontibacillus litoralis]|uniref:ethanolamine utilization phosphate acetyltransferase EutD n=1 Tax=Pontibacillus litoralis TaxID=516703 RepID=UPI0022B6D244|nr:ethanolamine utilization phosphate acetyltransferase EutD [Pontibacillus litoralis]